MEKQQRISGTCIYCPSVIPSTKREHVVSQALGTFEQSWTLDCVCDICNQFFGDSFELLLGRDSFEGLLRITTGVKPAEAIENFRNRTVTFSLAGLGPLEGVHVRMCADGASIIPTPTPQVGFRTDGGDWEFVLERDLSPESIAKFSGPCVEVKILGIAAKGDLTRLKDRLRALGIEFAEQYALRDQPMSPDGKRFSVLHTFNITDVHRRAAAKICFNYMAKVMGAAFARRREFDVIRRFIRNAEGNGAELVSVQRLSVLVGTDATTSRTHGLGLEWQPDRRELIGIATFFNEMTYGVRLGHNPTDEWAGLSSLHFFDPQSRQISVAGKGV